MAKSPKGSSPAYDVTSAEVGDVVVLADGRTATIDGICLDANVGNSVLIGQAWLDANLIIGTAS